MSWIENVVGAGRAATLFVQIVPLFSNKKMRLTLVEGSNEAPATNNGVFRLK